MNMNMKITHKPAAPKTVAIYSGGMDSFTLVHELSRMGRLAACLSFDYGQRHVRELNMARFVCNQLRVHHHVIDLRSLAPHMLGSALTDKVAVPEGHYAEESMKLTVVPNRNAIMLNVAIAFAVSHKLDEVAFAAHAGDHTIYPDCREEFVAAMNVVGLLANWHPVRVVAPYVKLTKAEILAVGLAHGLDYSDTWTCYKGGDVSCGVCGSCTERQEAFVQCGTIDPLPYASRYLMKDGGAQ